MNAKLHGVRILPFVWKMFTQTMAGCLCGPLFNQFFLPQTAVALAAACAIDAYNPYDGGGCYTKGGGSNNAVLERYEPQEE